MIQPPLLQSKQGSHVMFIKNLPPQTDEVLAANPFSQYDRQARSAT
jgi:hypothetical protein